MAVVSAVHPSGPGAAGRGPGSRRPLRSGWTPYLMLLPGTAWLVAFFLAPVLTLFGTSTQEQLPGSATGQYTQTFHLATYLEVLDRYWPQFLRSFGYAATATAAALLIGYPLAYAIAFRAGRWRNVMLVAVVAPFFCSFVLRTLAWGQVLGDGGPVVRTLKAVHVLAPHQSLTATGFAVVSGITYNFLPFTTLPIYASLERIDRRLLEAGGDLYASPGQVLRRVTLPLSLPGVVAGTLLTFIPAAGDYVNAAILGNPRTAMIGNVIESRFFALVDYPAAAALSLLLMASILVLVTVYIRRSGTEELV